MHLHPQHATLKLTALWALIESGLGGMLFALHIPLTGMLVGGSAVILLSLISYFGNNSGQQLMTATATVLLVKLTVSPHAPFPAYLAVLFQGCMAAIIFPNVKSRKLACILLATLAMLESATQKLLLLLLFFGRNLWDAVNITIHDLTGTTQTNFAGYIIFFYILIHLSWALLLGNFAAALPGQLQPLVAKTLKAFRTAQPKATPSRRPVRHIGLLTIGLVTIFMMVAFKAHILTIFFRSLLIVVLLRMLISPLVKYCLERWSAKQAQDQQQILLQLPLLKTYIPAALHLSKQQKGWLQQARQFLVAMVILTLYEQD